MLSTIIIVVDYVLGINLHLLEGGSTGNIVTRKRLHPGLDPMIS